MQIPFLYLCSINSFLSLNFHQHKNIYIISSLSSCQSKCPGSMFFLKSLALHARCRGIRQSLKHALTLTHCSRKKSPFRLEMLI